METRLKYVIVGLFVVLLGGASIILFLWLSQGLERHTYERYYTYARESVSGLSLNAPVKYRGVEVGRVKEIIINPDNVEEVRLALDIDRGTPVKQDTVAILRVQGLTGLAFVELEGGSRKSPLLLAKPGEPYPVIRTGPSLLLRLDAAVSSLMTGMDRFTEDARSVIDEENRARLKRILEDLSRITHQLAQRSDTVDKGIESAGKALENMARITDQIDARIPSLMRQLDNSAAALQGAAGDVSLAGRDVGQASREFGALVRDNRQGVDRFTRQTLPEAGALVVELRQLIGTLQRLSRQLEEEPNSLVLGRPPAPPGPGEGKEERR